MYIFNFKHFINHRFAKVLPVTHPCLLCSWMHILSTAVRDSEERWPHAVGDSTSDIVIRLTGIRCFHPHGAFTMVSYLYPAFNSWQNPKLENLYSKLPCPILDI